jgi:hypothetical protein
VPQGQCSDAEVANAFIPIALELLIASFATPLPDVAQQVPVDWTVLPQPSYPRIAELDARNVKPPQFFQVKAPNGARLR